VAALVDGMLDGSVRDDLELLIALVDSLGLAEYKWLPMELRWESSGTPKSPHPARRFRSRPP
jgi:hypothetical protein